MKFLPWTINRLEELTQLWNQEIGKEFPMREQLFKQNSFQDLNVFYDGSLIALNDNDNVIGFIITKIWQEGSDIKMSKEVGWIQAIVVDHHYQNQLIGSKLLEHAETKLKSKGINKVFLGRDPWHYFPGIPEQYETIINWFEQKGYQKNDREFDLINHYQRDDKMVLPEFDRCEFQLLSIEDKENFLSFLNQSFPGRWEYEAIKYFQLGGTGREFVVLKKDGKIIGFCRINDSESPIIAQNVYWEPLYDSELGGAGPLGIDANERKNGYGLAIVEAGIYFLRQRGIKSIVIDWTGLVDFYKKLGYEICQSYVSYKKEFKSLRRKL